MNINSHSPSGDTYLLALNLCRQGNLIDARKLCQKKLSQEPRHAATLHLAGLISVRELKFKEAIKLFKKAIKSDGKVAQYYSSMAEALATTGDFVRAKSTFRRAVLLQPENVNFLYGLGTVNMQMGAFTDAVAALSRAIELAPNEGEFHAQLGVALQKDDVSGSISAYDKAIELGSNSAFVYFNLSTALSQNNDYSRAIVALKEVIRLDPQHQRSYRSLGHIHLVCGDYHEAVSALRRAIELAPEDSVASRDLGSALLGAGITEEAISVYEQLIKLDPVPTTESISNMALAYLCAGKAEEALKLSDSGLEIVGNETSCLAFKSTALNHLGRRNEAGVLLDFDRLIFQKQFNLIDGYNSTDEFNAKLSEFIVKHPDFAQSKLNRGLKSGKSIPPTFLEGPLPTVLETFHSMILSAISDFKEATPVDPNHPFLSRHPNKTRIEWWGTQIQPHGYLDTHFHPVGWLSGVYYPVLSEAFKAHSESREGWIEFGREYYKIKSEDNPPVFTIKPDTGLMVLFPSYFGHRTLPFSIDDERMSVAFDVIPVE